MADRKESRMVLLVDDHPGFRDGLKSVINSHGQFLVVAETATVEEALSLLEQCTPDLLVTDLRLAGGCGHELVEECLKRRPGLQVMVISVNSHPETVERAVRNGVHAFVPKGVSGSCILRALDELLEGRSFLPDQSQGN